MFGKTQTSARDFVLSWVREKLPDRNVTNFDKDWKDGVLICELVNATQPGLIPPKLYADKSNGEGNAKLGMQIAHDAFGIPQVISSFDLASGQLDELSLLTYLALFCKYESLHKGSGSGKSQSARRATSDQDIACKAYGAGLRSSELGKVAEFVVELNGAKPTDITIAIECKPLRGAVHDDKPDLSVKPVNKNTYCVKYLPTRPGDYVISILHCGAHILRSPFYLAVLRQMVYTLQRRPRSFTHKTFWMGPHLMGLKCLQMVVIQELLAHLQARQAPHINLQMKK